MKQFCGRATNSVHVCTADQAQSLERRALQRFLGFKEESNTEATNRFFWNPRKKQFLGCLWRSFPVALKPSTLQLCNAQQLYWWTPLETLKHHLISRPKHSKTSQKWPEKLPNVASETLEKNDFWAAFGVAFLSLWSLQPCNFSTRNSSTDGHHSKRWNTT